MRKAISVIMLTLLLTSMLLLAFNTSFVKAVAVLALSIANASIPYAPASSLQSNQPNDSLNLSVYDSFGEQIQQMLEDVTKATAYQYDAKDNQSLWLQTIKIIKNPVNGYLGIYHTPMDDGRFVVRLANSTDLLNWMFIRNVTYDASQPTIAQAPNSAYIVALEKKEPDCKSHLQFQYYSNLQTLLNGFPNATLDAPRTLSNSNEGTPNIYNITIEGSLMKVSVGFHFLNSTVGLDRVAAGWLTIPLDNPENMTWGNVTELYDYNNKLASMGVQGNIGDRDYVQILGRNYTLQEAQLRKDDWSSWRIFLYDHSKNDFSMLNVKTHKGSVSFSNPTCTVLNSPNNKTCVLTTYFIHTNGSANGEAGQLIFYKEYLTVPTDYQKIQEAINAAGLGSTIFVRNGTYNENVVINKMLSLLGENCETTIIDGVGTEDVVSISMNNVTVTGFTIRNSDQGYAEGNRPSDGIGLEQVENCNIYGNIMTDNSFGTILHSSHHNCIFENNITANKHHGIGLWDSSNNNNVSRNNITANNIGGILLAESSGNNITGNNVTANNALAGIQLEHSSNYNIITGNNIANNSIGIWLEPSSSYNKIIGNNITHNHHGVELELSSNYNIIFHNNFNTNDPQASADQSCQGNLWDNGYPSGGNYWSNNAGKDDNGDGICDSAYVIDGNNKDNYPLISPWSPSWVPKAIIEAPFWMQWWFWTIVITGTAISAGAVFFLRKRKLPKITFKYSKLGLALKQLNIARAHTLRL